MSHWTSLKLHPHGCSGGDVVSAGCPVHAIWDQIIVLQKTFPKRWSKESGFDWSLPLFPDVEGRAVEKEAMADTIRAAAGHLGVALASPDLTEQVTGHSLRATGAQGLARAGVEEWAIQLLGRWGSKAIRLYTRQAALER
jgi:integrase